MNASSLDENLIVQMGRGDGEAFRKTYLATSSIVYGYALSILKNRADAEDVMHDAYIRAFHAAATYQPLGKPLAWLLTIVRNLCYNKARSSKPTVDIGTYEQAAPIDEEQGALDRIVLQKALEILDEQERQIVVLHAIAGMKHREIGEVLELPTGTVLSKYHRALKRLKSEIAGREETA
ncbi:MAG: RNA polymerase sigma factor [Coriobacteriia bacterium]|nr:RNA polymerase sigma factor [Coriobacteriia bacterium]